MDSRTFILQMTRPQDDAYCITGIPRVDKWKG
jgi:hypothetical protein